MTPFEKALLQAVNDDFSHVPPEEALDFSPIIAKKATKPSTLRRCLLVAAICILLVSSVLAAYKYSLGSVEVNDITDRIDLLMGEDNENIYYEIKFSDDFVDPASPDVIEAFYLPTIMVGTETLERHNNTYISKGDIGAYHPFGVQPGYDNTKPEDFPRILEAPDSVSYGWRPSEHVHIGFSQCLTKCVTNGTLKGVHLVYENSGLVTSSSETVEIDEYSILTFNVDFTKKMLEMDPTFSSTDIWRNWYWTDGEYLFSLSSTGLTMEEMTDLFRSIKVVGTEYPYSVDEAQPDLIQENFRLPDAPTN